MRFFFFIANTGTHGKHGLYPLLQTAYRTCHSTETALLKVKNDILMNMNSFSARDFACV